jgi:hypothetical protein
VVRDDDSSGTLLSVSAATDSKVRTHRVTGNTQSLQTIEHQVSNFELASMSVLGDRHAIDSADGVLKPVKLDTVLRVLKLDSHRGIHCSPTYLGEANTKRERKIAHVGVSAELPISRRLGTPASRHW